MMKKGLALIILTFLSLFSVPVLADDSSAGVLPSSIWYSFDRFFEKTHLAITFNPTSRARLHLNYARERFDEASAELEIGNNENAEQLLNDYNYELIEAKKGVKSVEDGEEAIELSSEIESLTSENKFALQAAFGEIEEEERLRPEIRNYPYNITDAEEEKLRIKEQTEEELEKELEELEEASRDEGGA